MKLALLVSFVAVTSLAACATDVDPSRGRFVTNSVGSFVHPSVLDQISRAWKNDPMEVFGKSGAGKQEAAWTVDYIAFIEAQGITPCNDLRAVALDTLELKPFTIFDAAEGVKRTYSPQEYNEQWRVLACGKERKWRVLDDPADSSNPHTVLLGSHR